ADVSNTGYSLRLENSSGADATGQLTDNLVAGQVYTVSWYANSFGNDTVVSIIHDSTTLLAYTGTTSGWTRYELTFTATAASPLYMNLTVTPNGAAIQVSLIMVTKGSQLYDYFNGNFTDDANNTYTWDGAKNQSTSRRT